MGMRGNGITKIPTDHHITYQLQYRKCGKARCSTCQKGLGHGPYWYAYWREGARLRSGYVGKLPPANMPVVAAKRAAERMAVVAV